MIEVTEGQLKLLWHTLGLRPDCRDSRTVYRNRFLADPGHDDVPDLETLVSLGMMGSRNPPAFCDQSEKLYYATAAGKQFAVQKMPPPPKLSNFEEYLNVADCYEGFAQFLDINVPQYQQRGEWRNREYRMVRYARNSPYRHYDRHYSLTSWSTYETLEVAGEWAPTMKAAKASYKEALQKHRAELRSQAHAA